MRKTFFQRVRELSTIRGISEGDLAGKHGIPLSKMIEPDICTLRKLKKILKCPYSLLLDGKVDGLSFDDYVEMFEKDVAELKFQIKLLKKTG